MSNPLLSMTSLPPFCSIRPEHVEPAIDAVLAENRARLARLLERREGFTWANLAEPFEAMEDRLARVWSPVSHLNAVVNTPELREAYNACLPKLSDYATELGQNEALYAAFRALREGKEYEGLNAAQQRVIDNALQDFLLAGVGLSEEKKTRFKAYEQELSRLTAKFDENLLDATHGWRKHLLDESAMAGLPESSRATARQAAQREGLEGWLLTLEFPSYFAVMTYADDGELRRELYEAYTTRASDRGPNAGKWDNGPLMERIVALRHEQATLLGFANYAERSLAKKMARTPAEVMEFLKDLARRSTALAKRELQELKAFAAERFGVKELAVWDIGYYSEKLRQEHYAISQEDLRPYFPEEQVLSGLFEVVGRLFGVTVQERRDVESWHEQVRFFEIRDRHGALRGGFYLDLFARPNKRGGAWMDECISRRRTGEGAIQTPVAYLTCNFAPPVEGRPALLTHSEVETLYHEFGHGLQHLLTQVDYAPVSGIRGVPWDAVELPSQFLENWCWEREALQLFARHWQSGEPLPEPLHQRLLAAKNFQAGMQMVRQLEFALFDFRLYREYDPAQGARLQQILDEVRAEVAVVRPPEYNRFQHGFAHIFSRGYAAGYYSYKWAEVLAADAFARFEEEGVFNREAGQAFLETILEQGGARDPLELFVSFRGREPTIEALLRRSGIAA